jgi:adenylate cyclase
VGATRRLAAIMFTDMVGYTALTQSDEASTLQLLGEQEQLVRPLLALHQGREVKSTGDGFLIEFDSALRAVQCAIDIHERLHARNSRKGVAPIALRIGVHLGDVEERSGDIFGDAVNIASRIEPLAAPEGVCVSGQVFDQVRNKIPNRFQKLGPQMLKNVRVPTEVYRVTFPWEPSGPTPDVAGRTRLAVLPLANISPDPKDEYFADGLTEELISALSKVRELRVIARTSVSQYKTGAKSVSQIGSELGVGTVLEGSVRKAGNRLRITLQLIDVGTQEHMWAHSYDRELDDVFAIQTEIAEKTADVLRVELLGPERESIRRKPTSNLEAYNLYLRAIHSARLPSAVRFEESVRLFEEAIAKDPHFSLAYSHLANMYLLQSGETIAPRVAFHRAEELVTKALELDPSSSDAHTARGNLALQHGQDWKLAEEEFRQAISLSPSDANAHFWYAILLVALQRFDQAVDELRTTMELDPIWEDAQRWLLHAYALSGDLAPALVAAEENRDRDPAATTPRVLLGLLYLRAGRVEEARREADAVSTPSGRYERFDWAVLHAKLGRPEEARRFLEELKKATETGYVSPTLLAGLCTVLGDRETALAILTKDYEAGESGLWLEYQLMDFGSIRDDPRFQSILRGMKLPTNGAGRPGTPLRT